MVVPPVPPTLLHSLCWRNGIFDSQYSSDSHMMMTNSVFVTHCYYQQKQQHYLGEGGYQEKTKIMESGGATCISSTATFLALENGIFELCFCDPWLLPTITTTLPWKNRLSRKEKTKSCPMVVPPISPTLHIPGIRENGCSLQNGIPTTHTMMMNRVFVTH